MKEIKDKLIKIGESLHASIPSMGKLMRDVFDCSSSKDESIRQICSKIREQAIKGASYIEVNVDEFYAEDARKSTDMMRLFVSLVADFGEGVPVCIDSSNYDLLVAGLESWYDSNRGVMPMINSVKLCNMEALFPFNASMPYVFIALIMSDDLCAGRQKALDKVLQTASTIFNRAMHFGFVADEIYFDTAAYPLAIDLPMIPGQPGRTWLAFESIRAIRAKEEMKGVHFSLGISNCFRDLPGAKTPIAAAYLKKAFEYGLDAGIVNVCGKLFESTPSDELLEMVESFSNINGDADNLNLAMASITVYCRSKRQGRQ